MAEDIKPPDTPDKKPLKLSENPNVKKDFLVVDDENNMRFIYAHLIGMLFPNSSVRRSHEGKEVEKLIQEKKPDVVITGFNNYPELDGFQVVKRIKELIQETKKRIAIIACHAKGKEIDEGFLRLGVPKARLLGKPFRVKDLVDILQKIIDEQK